MKKYRVCLSADFEVEARDEDEALDLAVEMVMNCEETLYADSVDEVT